MKSLKFPSFLHNLSLILGASDTYSFPQNRTMSKNCILRNTLLEFLLSTLFSRLDIDTCGTDTSEPSFFYYYDGTIYNFFQWT